MKPRTVDPAPSIAYSYHSHRVTPRPLNLRTLVAQIKGPVDGELICLYADTGLLLRRSRVRFR